ncbi:Conidial yellow pigment biosynthesis polyketide synthase [Madurella mycetomatis]|uniref:Conidial yellow pigment biosynthesis polyketide synthase n=1 Tax=Madurella mycetomatis TaxID=100816 RepID=A0A175W6F9_9PEZI|nr:Conidial yellow pigment biosynthesis polyketide synthase [Madurella mycetomatis]
MLDHRYENAGARAPLSGAFFCPQSRAPDPDYLAGLHLFLSRNRHGQALLREVANLETDETWTIFAAASEGVRSLTLGPRYLGILRDWALHGVSGPLAEVRSGIVALPLLAILQVGQYLRYLEFYQLSHQEFLAQVRHDGGLQGYCGGLPAAVAIACARDEAAVIKNTATILRILVGVGAYAEAADDTRDEDGSTTLALRLKHEGQGDELTSQFPGTHVSAITEPRSISIAGPAAKLDQLYHFARDKGLQVQKMQVRGNVHNPENAGLAADLVLVCHETPSLRLPEASELQVPVRSNRTTLKLQDGSLAEEIIATILASRCEWFSLLGAIARDLRASKRASHSLVVFGLADCVPLIPFHKENLRVTKTEAHGLITRVSASRRNCGAARAPALGDDAVAVIGASCRLPGANDLEELWGLLAKGADCHRELPTNRFDLHGSFRASQGAKFAGGRRFYGNFLDDVERFDAAFFKVSPREAANIDPQQRVLLELSYEALEAAGYLRTHCREQGDNVGCFIGASFVEYLDNTNAHPPTAYTSTGTIRAFLCGRISHYYGWSGPAEVLDTACSSSLVAIHRACRAIQGGECRMALAGGANIMTGINNYLDLAKAGFLSPTGQCKPFDASADGYCRSEGAGLVVLKKLKQALADGDQILGVIPAAATNQGGLSCSITVPQPTAQQELYRTVLTRAGFGPEHVTYVEAHGTGTQAGDPIEMESIRAVLAKDSTGSVRQGTLYIGSVKGNIGHCETAAGVAGLLKVLAMLKHGRIPAQANHSLLNPKIPSLEADKLAIARSVRDWDVPFRAALISSYGAAGSNCALLCCEVGSDRGLGTTREFAVDSVAAEASFPLLMSADSEQSLRQNAGALANYLRSSTAAHSSLADVAFTLNERRQRLKYFASITARNVQVAVSQMHNMARSLDASSVFQIPPHVKPAVLVFSGQRDQAIALHRSLYDHYPIFRSYVDACDSELSKLGYSNLVPTIFQTQPVEDLAILQCGIFAVQYACARCWMDAGLRPKAVVGHSLGELTALCVSGVLSLHDAIKLVAARGRLVERKWSAEKGAMLALGCSVDEFRTISRLMLQKEQQGAADSELEIACYNGSSSLVVVGASAVITVAEDLIRTEPSLSGIRSRRLSTTHGFHSALVDPILTDLATIASSLTWNEPNIPLYTCTAEPLESITEAYDVARHARQPVFFSEAVQRIERSLGPCLWFEAGMDSPIINMVMKAAGDPGIHTFQGMKVTKQAATQMPVDAVGDVVSNLWKSGLFLSHWSFLTPVNLPESRAYKQIWLPPYQFQRSGHWLPHIDRVVEAQRALSGNADNSVSVKPLPPPPLVTRKSTSDERPGVAEFEINTRSERFQKLVGGHAVRSRPLCPASVYVECATMAALQLLNLSPEDTSLVLEQVRFLAPLGVEPQDEVTLRLEQGQGRGQTSWSFSVSMQQASLRDDGIRSTPKPSLHASGRISLLPSNDSAATTMLDTFRRLVSDAIDRVSNSPEADRLMSGRAYTLFSRVVDYDHFFRAMHCITLHEREAAATIRLPDGQPGREHSTAWKVCDAVMLDACIQVAGLLVNSSGDVLSKDEVAVMIGLDRAVVSTGTCSSDVKPRKVYAKLECGVDGLQLVGDVFVFDDEGRMTAVLCGCRFTKLLISKLETMLDLPPQVKPQVDFSPDRKLPDIVISSDVAEGSVFNATPSTLTFSGYESDDTERNCLILRGMIAEYIGLDISELPNDTMLSDLGLDSLASVELAEQISTKLSISIDASDLAVRTLNDLARRLGHNPGIRLPEIIPREPSPYLDSIKIVVGGQESSDLAGDEKLLKILSECSGVKLQDIAPQHGLADLGIDSLSLVELQEELRGSFSGCLDGLDVSCTVQDLMTRLGIDGPQINQTDANPDQDSSATTDDLAALRVDDAGQGASVIRENPIDALESSDAHFNSSAGNRGFLGYWANVAPLQDEITVAYIVDAFSALGVDLREIPCGHPVPQVPYLARKHGRLVTRLWEILQKHNLVSVNEKGHRIRGESRGLSRPLAELHATLEARYPCFRGEADLMRLTGPRLAECLVGTADPVRIMFGDATSLNVMENYYGQSPMLSTMTEQLTIFLTTLLKGLDTRTQPVRILEVGAGTGGTTRRLLEALESAGIAAKYMFTDISPGLVSKARVKFGHYPWVEFATLDLEKEIPVAFRSRFDVVIGTNCVHATTDRTATCCRLRGTLSNGGVMVLSEVTRIIDWYDIAFGLLDGWWLAEGQTAYPLQAAEWWMSTFRAAGFPCVSYSRGATPEATTQRLLVACTGAWPSPTGEHGADRLLKGHSVAYHLETIVYKEVGGVKVHADVYFPTRPSQMRMPIALMIHGGGYMTLSRRAIRPAQTRHLLANGFLPVSIDYRLCPEVDMIKGPVADVCSAYAWAKTRLPALAASLGFKVDATKVVAVGWSSGGHLAMSLGWTAREAGIEPPSAILSFYAPYDFESGELDLPRLASFQGRKMSLERILAALPSTPITEYSHSLQNDTANLGWLCPGDARSELVLSLFKDGIGLPLLIHGLTRSAAGVSGSGSRINTLLTPPARELVASISPLSRLRAGEYTVPTYIIHGTADEVVPVEAAERFVSEARARGVRCGFLAVPGGRHVHDVGVEEGSREWEEGVEGGYRFLLDVLKEVSLG